jgi:NAD(P)-dependent dehydrogenase (short-subunit alcohol dehydrogenase family)
MDTNRVALVSGGNRGLGLETCRQLAALGYRVYLGSRNLESGAEAASGIGDERVEAVKLDVTSAADVEALARHIEDGPGRLDVLINNAGIMIDSAMGRSGSILDTDIDIVEQSLRINTLAPIRLINAMLPLMKRVDDARIVNISSGLGQLADMGGRLPGYRISKTALNAVTRIFAAELDPAKFRINAVCPGWVRTDMGGDNADLSVAEGVDTVIWLATAADATGSGGYYRERKPIDW